MTMRKITADDPLARSADLLAENVERLKALFPEAFTEGKIDFALLKELLGDHVDEGEEKYGLNWHGKRQARRLALTPSTGTLRPCPEESVEWETTQNLMIEGDNLEVLKLLQTSYAGKVKMIYIDPPYNTGKDFVYPDDYRDNLRNYLERTGQVDGAGWRISSNTEASGRFHTNWLNMMYPRLRLARNLLRDDGVIFISIDDGEIENLKLICNTIFGEENFVSCVVWQKTYSPANDKVGIDAMHDFLLCYKKNEKFRVNLLPRTTKQDDAYSNPDNDPRGPWKAVDSTRAEHREYAYYPITTPSGKEVFPAQGRSWVFTKDELPLLISDNRLWFGKDGMSKPSKKLFLSDVKQGVVPTTWWDHKEVGHNDEAKKDLKSLMMEGLPFETPKPIRLIKRAAVLSTCKDSNDIVLDFFAGSGTTAHAVLDMNQSDGGNRRFILVQLPEPTGQKEYPTIAEITKERVRRVIKKLNDADAGQLDLNDGIKQDRGFRVFKLDTSNIRPWQPDRNDLEGTLLAHEEHLVTGRGEQDLLFELLLKLGLELTVPMETRTIAGKAVHSIGLGTLMVCLAEEIGRNDVDPLAQGLLNWWRELDPAVPVQFVFRDSGFVDDVAKTNLAAILEQGLPSDRLAGIRSL